MKLISRNPATENIEARFATLTKAQLEHKLSAAHRAFASWSQLPFEDFEKPLKVLKTRFENPRRTLKLEGYSKLCIEKRCSFITRLSKLILKRKSALAELATREMGKSLKAAQSEIEKCALCCNYYANNTAQHLSPLGITTENTKSYVRFEPLGVVLGIMPWNFPYWQVFRFAIPALAAGNVVLVKHASNVPRCALALEKLFCDAGFPKGVYGNLFLTSKEIPQLIADARIAAVSLTGSVAAGKEVASAAGSSLKKVVLELGGSDPFIVLADADIEQAAKTAAQARMSNTGQSCIAAKRFIVVKSVVQRFESLFVEHMNALKLGSPRDKKTQVCPLAREDILITLHQQVKRALQQGAHILLGGRRAAMHGYYYLPTVLTHCTPDMDIAQEEVFGPVACIYVVKDENEALELANATRFGLGASIWTRNIKKAEALARRIESGFVAINGMVRSDPRLPFGGIKDSGFGRELGEFGIREFVNVKTVVVN